MNENENETTEENINNIPETSLNVIPEEGQWLHLEGQTYFMRIGKALYFTDLIK